MTLVEHVARAIERAIEDGNGGNPEFLARAALEAMREPTLEMIEAGASAIDTDPANDVNSWARRSHRAMIDAALSSLKEEGDE